MHLEHLTKGSERERKCGGVNLFFKHFSLCLLRTYLMEPHSSHAANCPIGRSRTLWTAFPSVLTWNSHRDFRIALSEVLNLCQVHALSICDLLNSEYVYLKL